MKKTMIKKLSIAVVFVLIFSLITSTAAFAIPADGWNEDQTMYYSDGAALTGLQKIDGEYYLFSDSGVLRYGWKNYNGARYYFDEDEDGAAAKGLTNINGAYYFFNNNTAKMLKGWQTVNGKKSRFSPKDGKALTGLKKVGKFYYGFTKRGELRYGWKNINGQRFYFNPKSGKAVTGFKKIKGGYYYFSKGARMQTGWKTVKGYKYYFNTEKGSNYGRALTGGNYVDGTYYKFNNKGQLITPEMKMTSRAQKYTSDTNYLILVNKSTHRVGIFKRNDGDWKMIKYYLCTIGAPGTPTPSGTFRMGYGRTSFHQRYFDSGAIRCWYASNFYGEYHFHSVLYVPASGPYRIAYGQLGANLSHGCIRLKLENAKWIYDNIPRGTKVVIYS
ncbi:MAG: L,D-transpeptidase family protein [Eubacterium sp.]|nr:L,D-transpeptidase family protein [Eubacterium sp.]